MINLSFGGIFQIKPVMCIPNFADALCANQRV